MCACVNAYATESAAIYPGVSSYLQVGEWDFDGAVRGRVSFYLYSHLDDWNFSKVYNEHSNSTVHLKKVKP